MGVDIAPVVADAQAGAIGDGEVAVGSVHLSLNAVNAIFQESVRALYTGWYLDVVTKLPVVENGMVTVDPDPGIGIDLLPDLHRRDDATVRVSEG